MDKAVHKRPLKEIAVIGIASRFPGARTPDEFWNLLCQKDRPAKQYDRPFAFDIAVHYDPNPTAPDKTYCNSAAILDDIQEFDPGFFNILPKEAEIMDPLQRIVLEEAWNALEDAGLSKDIIAKTRGGFFLGSILSEYFDLMNRHAVPCRASTLLDNLVSCIPGRVANFLDLKGPVLSVDTACSSSLTAIHLAIEQLQSGDADWMIAGGTNLILTETLFISASKAGILSPEGQCRAFDANANGIGLGEGVGLVVLKPLSDAIRDKDRIYGVIQASEINHDGYTNGLGAPNRKSQTDLHHKIFSQYDIDPKTISYVEAHGTGTTVGDFIEFSALTDSFRKFTDKKQYCAIGTSKTAFEHSMGAAGVAGITKLVLALYRAEIPGHHRFFTPNPHIDFKNSPFFINTELIPWDSPADQPRRGAINSFGLSGTNVHMVVDAGPTFTPGPTSKRRWYPIVLSTKRPQEMTQKINDLLNWIATQTEPIHLPSISFTLTKGRTAFKHRHGFAADSVESLIAGLQALLSEKKSPAISDETDPETVEFLTQFVNGSTVNWPAFFESDSVSIVSLPHYPFQREIYWAPNPDSIRPRPEPENTYPKVAPRKMIAEIAFDSKMDIVNQHRVDQGLILAGAIQLNAVLEISGFRPTAGKVVRFQDILFQRPIRIAQETQISLQLTRTETNEYQFSITNCESDSIYTDGRISLKEPEIILSEAAHSNLISIPTDQFETAIRSAGLDHGPLYQVVSEIQYADTLAKSILKIPPMWQTLETQPLAISLVLDGAFQTAAALIDPAHGLFIPHRIRSMEIFHTGAFSAYSCEANLVERSDTITFDISVKSDSGQTVALLKGFSLAPVAKGPSDTVTVQVLEPAWHPFEKSGNPTQANRIWIIGSSSSNFEITSRPDGTAAIIHAIYPSSISSLIDSIDAAPFTPQIILLDSKWIGPSADSALQVLFELGQRLFKIQPAHPINIFWLQENGGFADSILSMVIGFARTLYRENPFIRLHGVTIASDTRPDIRELFFLDHEIPTRIRINEQTIETEKLQLSAVQKPQQSPPLHGTDYNILVTGGLGGIGTHLIRELTHHWQVNVIAIGRRPASPETERRCKQLAGPGTRVLYFSADVSQVDELEQALIQAAVPIHGVFHLAGRIEDRRFQDKAWTEFQSVIAPKIDGVLHLDALTRTQPLAFFTIFGSVTGILGNVGQADYSAANGFLNGFAEYRRFLSASGIRNGVTTCIGWPLWEEGGMAPDIKWLELMESNLKTRVRMPNREAWNLLPGLICGASAAPVVIAGKIDQLKQKDSIIQGLTTSPQSPSSELRPGGVLPKSRDELLVEVQTMFNVFFQLPTHAVGFESDIEEFGLDSIAVMDFVDSFYKKTGIELNPSLFFSFRTIGELIDHILTTHVEQNQDASVAPVR